MKAFVVYRHLFPNGKSYIGITSVKPISRRWRGGSSYKKQPKMYHAITKYGWKSVSHEVLVENLALSDANLLEQAFIEAYDSVSFGYNVSTGGGGTYGIPCSDETRLKIGNANRGRSNPGCTDNFRKWQEEHGAWNKGKFLADEHYQKIAEERKRRCSKQIVAVNPLTEQVVIKFDSCTEAAEYFGVTKNVISRCARGGRKTSAGYEWRYADESR